MKGKIVLVGVETPEEKFALRRGLSSEERYGYELHADAMNTLFQPLTIRPLAAGWQFLSSSLCLWQVGWSGSGNPTDIWFAG